MKSLLSSLLLSYFRILAQVQLAKIHPKIIGITGSAGKTSTLHAVHAVLKPHFSTKASYKANSESGLPLNILGLQAETYSLREWLTLSVRAPLQLLTNWKRYDLYLAEMGIDGPHPPKNMGYLLRIFQPSIGVLLNARPMHSYGFDALIKVTSEADRPRLIKQAIAREKGKMIVGLPANGLAVLNADDPAVLEIASETRAKVVTFGKSDAATLQIHSVRYQNAATISTFRFGSEKIMCKTPQYLLPEHMAYSFAVALLIGQHLGLTWTQAADNLAAGFKLPPGRSTMIPAVNGAQILDSSYNSSAQAALDMLTLLDEISTGRKLALLGDIRELGKVAAKEHTSVAQKAAQVCDLVVLVGPQMQQYAEPVLKAAKIPTYWFANAWEAGDFLKSQLQKNDVLLVKGSQNTLLLEIAVATLMRNPETADQLLCRRGAYWDQRRLDLKPDRS